MKKYKSLINKIVPPHKLGKKTGAASQVLESNLNKSKERYELAVKRLLDVNNWENISGSSVASFYLYNAYGKSVKRPAKESDLIAIDVPGPGPKTGNGFDWVVIEKIKEVKIRKENTDVFSLRVRPSTSPLNSDKDIAHFYTKTATSTFIITRKGNKIKAEEKGHNEIANTKTNSVIDNLRNAAVAFTASHGLAYPQWKILMKGILGISENENN
ncbi:MAG: hypothetical protein ABIT08_05290 [Bacteroidia bacterium]